MFTKHFYDFNSTAKPYNEIIGNYYVNSFLVGSTMCFAVLSLSQLFHSFNMKSKKPFLLSHPFENKFLILSFLGCFSLLAIIFSVPSVSSVFGCCSLNKIQCYIVCLLSISTIIFVDLKKLLSKILFIGSPP